MPPRARTALAAALPCFSFLAPFAVPARADGPLAVSGPYTLTLTQPLLDADADYLGWAAGRALSPAERQRLAALETAQFRRDPAGELKISTPRGHRPEEPEQVRRRAPGDLA